MARDIHFDTLGLCIIGAVIAHVATFALVLA